MFNPTLVNGFLVGMTVITGLNLSVTPPIAAAQTGSINTRLHQVKVFFPKNPEQQSDLSYVQPVWRQSRTANVAQSAIAQVLAGPTRQERQQGFVAPINLRGASNCGKDFTLSITLTVARLRFCRQVVSGGVGDDARIISSLNATLKQFPTVRSVVILDQEGNCLGDMSGDNRCLHR
jgi:hypothetical protein